MISWHEDFVNDVEPLLLTVPHPEALEAPQKLDLASLWETYGPVIKAIAKFVPGKAGQIMQMLVRALDASFPVVT